MIFHKFRTIFIRTYIEKAYLNLLSITSTISSEVFSIQEFSSGKLVARFLLC